MKREILFLVAMLVAASAVNANGTKDWTLEQYESAVAGTVVYMQDNKTVSDSVFMELAALMDRGEWA